MDTNMEDVRMPLAESMPPISTPAPPAEPASIPTLDGWIESLMSCKQLSEADVQRLCDKVRTPRIGREADSRRSRVLLNANKSSV